jgi:hypothetical protein
MIQSNMFGKLISTIIVLMLSLATLSAPIVSIAHAAEFEAGADPSFVQASTAMSFDKPSTSTFSSESESDYNYVSHVFTVADVIFFSYMDGTMLVLYDSSGTLIWNNGGNSLNKGGHAHVTVAQGVYTACGSEKFAVLTGDPITRYVLGYYAMDQNGYGASTELYTWVPVLYGHCSFVVFAYEDNTQVTVDETDTVTNIATFSLNKGQHWQIETLQSKWLHITANHPVSALTCYDQGYLVPSANGRWSGTEFYTYVSDIAGWPEDLTVISYNDDTLVTIKDSTTGSLVWSGEVDEGQAHVESFPSGANRFFTITSSKSVTVAVQPWVAMTSNYHQGLYIGDSTGTRLGTDLIGSTLDGGYLCILAYKDNTNVVVYDSRTKEFVKSYALNDGDYVDANPRNGLWRIMSNYPVSAYSGWGQWNAEFAPIEFRAGTPVRVEISPEKLCYATSELVTIRAKVTDAVGNPLYPLQKGNFKISVDGSDVVVEGFERISCIDYKLVIKAPQTVGTHSIVVTATVANGKGSDSAEIKVYTINKVTLTIGGNRLTQYENSADTPIYYRGDSNIYPTFYIDVEVDGATLSDIRNCIEVFVNIDDHIEVRDTISIKAIYDPVTLKYKGSWKNIPDNYPVGEYDITAEVRCSENAGVDTTTNVSDVLDGLKSEGILFIGRYFAATNTWKALTKDESQKISDAGLYIVSIWQEVANSQEYFSYALGKNDGKNAFKYAAKVGQTPNTPVFFAVDFDVTPSYKQKILGYFEGVSDGYEEYLNERRQNGLPEIHYKIGIYGSYDVLDWCKRQGIATYFFQAYPPGWSNGRNSNPWSGYNLRQISSEQTVCNIYVDYDRASADFGGWSHGTSVLSSMKKHFYLIFKPPAGYESFVSVTHSTEVRSSWNVWKYDLHQFEYRNWKPTLDIITGKIRVDDAAQTLLLFAHGIDGSYYGYWHMDDDERLQVFDPTHPSGGDFIYESFGCLNDYGSSPWWWNQNAWWYDVDTFQDSNFNPEGYQLQVNRPVGVCADYAPLFISNLASSGIPAREIGGLFAEDGGHAVTEVYYDGQWHHYDPTWNMFDAPSIYSQVGDYWTQYLTRDSSPDSSQTVDRKDFYNYVAETTDITFDKTDYNYPDWVTAILTIKNIGHVDILTAHLHLRIYDHPTVARLGVDHLISDTKINSDATGNASPILAVGQSFTVTCTYRLPDYGSLNGFYEFLGDRYLVAEIDYYNDTSNKAHSIYAINKVEKEVPGLCSESCAQIAVDNSLIELNPETVTSFYFSEATNESSETFVKPQGAYVIVEHDTKYSVQYTREKWNVFNPDTHVHRYSLTTPLTGVGNAVYIPGYGPVVSNQSINTSANYVVIYDTNFGTNGFIDIYAFSRNMTLKNVMIFDGVVEIAGMQNCSLAQESGESFFVYLSIRNGYGSGFSEIYSNFVEEIVSNEDTLTQFFVEGEHEQISSHKVGDIVYVDVHISNNGIASETRNLSLMITESGAWDTENVIYSTAKTLLVSSGNEATVTFEYPISDTPQIGKHRIIINDEIATAETVFMIQEPFGVKFDLPTAVSQSQEFNVNATIINALDRSLSGINITIKLPNDFSTPETLTKNIGTLFSGESIDVSWHIVATDFEYGYEPMELYICSVEGVRTIASTSLTVLRLPEIRIFTIAPPEARPNIPFEFAVNVTNQGDLSLQSVSLSLQLPDGVTTTGSLTEPIGDLTPWETESLSWTITSMLDYDFWITVNASDIKSIHSALATELINVVKPEIELNVINPVEVILDQEFLLAAEVRNIGELAETDMKVSLTLPPELITTDPTEINVAYLSPGQTEVIQWTIQGVNPGYAEITVTASASSVSVTRGIIITHFPLSVKTDKETYLSGDNVILTATTTNENPRVSYVDLSINVTIDGPSLQDSYFMSIDFISNLETRNFALIWDSTGKPFGNYVVTAKLLENATVLNETTTSFTLTTVDDIPPTTLLTIGEPKYPKYVSTVTYVIPETSFTLEATDQESGVNSTFYEIYPATASRPNDWQKYLGPFNLTGYKNGNYTIAFYSVDNARNVESAKETNVTLCRAYDNPGDVTGDGKVDIYDMTMICMAYDSEPGDLNWNPIVDFCQLDWSRGIINIFDIVTCLQYYGP